MYTDFSNDNVRNSSNEEITAVLEKKKLLLINLIGFYINILED